MSEELDNIVDLSAFRKQKEEEEAEAARLKKELEEIEYMKYLLSNIMTNLGDPTKTGSLFYVPMSDDDYFTHYQFESGYNEEGYYESTWEWEGFVDEEDDEEDF